jgi:SHS2 domain-containing protein
MGIDNNNQHPSENFQNALKALFDRVVDAGKVENKDYPEMVKAVKIGTEKGLSKDFKESDNANDQ